MPEAQLNLDIGCDANKKPGFLGIDIHEGQQVDAVMDVCSLAFADGSVDQAYSRRCIQHVTDDRKALSEVFRILKPNGTLTLIVASWRGWLYFKLGFSRSHGSYRVFHLYSDGKLKRLMKEVGFDVLLLSHIPSGRWPGYDIEIIGRKP